MEYANALAYIIMYLISIFGFVIFIVAAFLVISINRKLKITNNLLKELVNQK